MGPLPPPMLRKSFSIDDFATVRRAVVYVTALGLYELRVNGELVGDRHLAPEWTDYRRRVQYQTFDVSDRLRAGENVLGVQLADGWYAGRIGLTGIVPGGPPRAIYGRQPRLLLQLEIHRDDGSIDRIVSDQSWRLTTDGPLRTADLLDGEVYDARRELAGWDRAGFDDSKWQAAGVASVEGVRLEVQQNEPIRITQEIAPVRVTEPAPNVHVFDMGQNFAGWCRVRLRGSAGQTVTLRHAEMLNPDGTIYVENLRATAATERFTLRGEATETHEPRFTYHGFRYVELKGYDGPVTPDMLTGCVLHSDATVVSEFQCSDPLLNRLWQNILWTQRANMHGLPTDCPQRDERCGWTGDILAFAQTACFNMDMAAFLTKWLADVRDAQTADGRFPDFAPHPFEPDKRFSGVPAWGDAGVFVPWCQYVNYGDRRLLDRHFE
jgi:alpha-L-rhamnosidase